jgi:L-ascorbate metabolism protein UlaG (beta-lactamase superfamily)
MKSSELNITIKLVRLFVYLVAILSPLHAFAHDKATTATYLANEGVMISSGDVKVLFDPFFHNDYGTYQLVPEKIINAIMENTAPYNNISVIFVSHAHGDHFAEQDMLAYMLKHNAVQLVAPNQAIVEMQKLAQFDKIKSRVTSIDLAYKDKPISFTLDANITASTSISGVERDSITVEAVRIPHAGWPGRAEVSNIVYRVTLPTKHSKSLGLSSNEQADKRLNTKADKHERLTFIHMGDAAPNDKHFRPLSEFWNLQKTTLAFPPYWFFLNSTGNYILDYRINTEKSVGVHVPKAQNKCKKSHCEVFSFITQSIEC